MYGENPDKEDIEKLIEKHARNMAIEACHLEGHKDMLERAKDIPPSLEKATKHYRLTDRTPCSEKHWSVGVVEDVDILVDEYEMPGRTLMSPEDSDKAWWLKLPYEGIQVGIPRSIVDTHNALQEIPRTEPQYVEDYGDKILITYPTSGSATARLTIRMTDASYDDDLRRALRREGMEDEIDRVERYGGINLWRVGEVVCCESKHVVKELKMRGAKRV